MATDRTPSAPGPAGPAGTPPSGIERDLRTIVVVQGLRAFLYGFGSILIGSVLATAGLSDAQVGLVFTSMLAGMALASIGVGLRGHRIRRRRLYTFLLLAMGAAGAVYAVTTWLPAMLLAALTGTLSTDPNESGPITSVEQSMIGESEPAARLRVFGRYNAVAYLAGSFGALAAGGPAAFRNLYPALPANRWFLMAFPLVALACAAVSRRLSPAVEPAPAGADGSSPARSSLHRSRRAVTKLSALFALDAFGGGFVVQAFMVFWFHRKFGAGPELMGLVFFGAGLLQAASSLVAARLGARIGLLNTMVFTHLPSNVLLAAVPFAPTLATAILLLLGRFALSQMDVPTRQAYVVAMVEPDERIAAAAYTNTARYAVRPLGPVGAGALMQHVALAGPFLAAGALKVLYDLTLYRLFRRAPVEAGRASETPRAPAPRSWPTGDEPSGSRGP
jgi:MFS family permease